MTKEVSPPLCLPSKSFLSTYLHSPSMHSRGTGIILCGSHWYQSIDLKLTATRRGRCPSLRVTDGDIEAQKCRATGPRSQLMHDRAGVPALCKNGSSLVQPQTACPRTDDPGPRGNSQSEDSPTLTWSFLWARCWVKDACLQVVLPVSPLRHPGSG